MTTTTKDAALLRELAAKMTSEATFAINTGNVQNATQQLRHALSCLERIQTGAQPGGFTGYSLNAVNEFAAYDLNNPTGEKKASA